MQKYLSSLAAVLLIITLSFTGCQAAENIWREFSYGFTDHTRGEMVWSTIPTAKPIPGSVGPTSRFRIRFATFG